MNYVLMTGVDDYFVDNGEPAASDFGLLDEGQNSLILDFALVGSFSKRVSYVLPLRFDYVSGSFWNYLFQISLAQGQARIQAITFDHGTESVLQPQMHQDGEDFPGFC